MFIEGKKLLPSFIIFVIFWAYNVILNITMVTNCEKFKLSYEYCNLTNFGLRGKGVRRGKGVGGVGGDFTLA